MRIWECSAGLPLSAGDPQLPAARVGYQTSELLFRPAALERGTGSTGCDAGQHKLLNSSACDIADIDGSFPINCYRMRHFKLPVVVSEAVCPPIEKPCGMANRSAPQRLSRIPLWPSKMSTVGRAIGVMSLRTDGKGGDYPQKQASRTNDVSISHRPILSLSSVQFRNFLYAGLRPERSYATCLTAACNPLRAATFRGSRHPDQYLRSNPKLGV